MMLIFNRGIFPQSSWSGTITPPSKVKGLCLILDQDAIRTSPEETMRSAVAAGIRFFQYRSKNRSRSAIYETCRELASLARKSGALFIVNDHADIAAAVDADGLHLGQDDLPAELARKLLGREKIIGISTHTPEQAFAAEAAGADYIGFGPVFETRTKDAGPARGVEGLAAIRKIVTIPIIAIGGINHTNARKAIDAGADGIAVISAILLSADIESAGRTINESFVNHR